MSSLEFVREQLNRPDVTVRAVAAETGISERLLQMLKAGEATNTSVERVEKLAAHFGYRLKPVKASRRETKSRAAA